MAGLNLHPHPGKCPAPWSPPPVAPRPPHPPGILGREAREKLLGLFLGVLRQGRGTSLSLGGSTGVRAGSALRARRPPGPGRRPFLRPRRRRVRGSAAFPSASCPPKASASAEIRASGGDSNPRAPAAPAQAGVFRIRARKEQARSTPFETCAPRTRILFLAKALARRPWAVLARPVAAGFRPAPASEAAGSTKTTGSGGRGPSRYPSVHGRRATARDSHPGRRAGTAAPGAPCSPAGRRARGAVGRRDPAAAFPKPREGSGVRADPAGRARLRKNLGSDIEPREKVAERARRLLPFPARGR